MKHLIALLMMTAVVLVGCDGGGGSAGPAPQPGTVGISCADLVNAGNASDCAQPVAAGFWPSAHAAVTIIDAGVISRAQMVEGSLTVSNTTASAWQGYWGMTFDAGCNGAPTWEIAPVQPTLAIAAGTTWSTAVGGSCGDMPIGQRTMTATLYGADPAEVVDVVEVRFELVE
ncbi:MAG: hypothetical protein AB1450_05075 [Pseudomonadota bacterium]